MARVDLRDRPICITGASAGIGRATAIACASAGMPVVVGARREDRLREVVGEIEGAGGRASAVVMDVADASACARMVEACVERYGSVYSVFANAGYGFERSFELTSEREWREIFEVNFWGTINVIRAALPFMRSAGRGHVLICSSVIGVVPTPLYGAYCATKAAQHHVGRALNLELRREGIFTTTVHPAWTRTEFGAEVRRRSSERDGAELMNDRKPGFLVQSPDAVARSVVRCLRRPRSEVWPRRAVRYGAGLAVAFPGLADWVLGRVAG